MSQIAGAAVHADIMAAAKEKNAFVAGNTNVWMGRRGKVQPSVQQSAVAVLFITIVLTAFLEVFLLCSLPGLQLNSVAHCSRPFGR